MGKPRITQEEHVRRVEEHGKYDVLGTYAGTKVKILHRCRRHDIEFMAWPNQAQKGAGCPACGAEKIGNALRKPVGQFLDECRAVHGDYYDYSLVQYTNKESKIEIICPAHGRFSQRAGDHLIGKGCCQCGWVKTGESLSHVLLGKQFGQLKVLQKVERPEGLSKSGSYWLVQCSCGSKPFTIWGSALTTNGVTQCRECSFKATSSKLLENNPFPTGSTFNQLTVLREWGRDKKGDRRALCLCECGKQTITLLWLLRNEQVKSCGCLQTAGGDTKQRFHDDQEWANSPCFFYVAEVLDTYLKPGITYNVERRAACSRGTYSSYKFVSPQLCRCEAWAIEQRILKDTEDAGINAEAVGLLELDGRTEIRDRRAYSIDWYRHRFYQLLEELAERGWERL